MNIKKLTASDFPGINESKFEEWKALRLKENRLWIFFGPALGTMIIAFLLFGSYAATIAGVVVYLVLRPRS